MRVNSILIILLYCLFFFSYNIFIKFGTVNPLDKLDLILEQLKELNSIMSAVRNRVDESDAKMDAISMDVNKIMSRVVALQDGQKRHEKLLEKLALRSIEQEIIVDKLQNLNT